MTKQLIGDTAGMPNEAKDMLAETVGVVEPKIGTVAKEGWCDESPEAEDFSIHIPHPNVG